MLDMPPVTHIRSGQEDPPFQGRMVDPYFPYQHPAEIMMFLFEQHAPYAEARKITKEAWEEYHERELTEEETTLIDSLKEEWSQRMFPFNEPMELLEFQIKDLDYSGWADIRINKITDELMIDRVNDLWVSYKEVPITDEERASLLERLSTHDRFDYPEDFPFPKPVDLLINLLDSGKMEMEVDKQFYDPELTTHGEKESRITATFSVEEKDKLEITYKMWLEKRRREWTNEEAQECMDLMIERGIIEPPPPVDEAPEEPVENPLNAVLEKLADIAGASPSDIPDEEEPRERSELTVAERTLEEIKQVAKDVFDGTSNIWFGQPEDGLVMMMVASVDITNVEEVGAIIGTNKLGGRVTSHNGGPYRASCTGFTILHKNDVKKFVAEFNRISEFMAGFQAPPIPLEDIPEDERPWEKVNISIRNAKEEDEGEE